MLGPLLSKLSEKSIVLASSSPRRKEILATAGLSFRVVPSRFDENLPKSDFKTRPEDYATETARGKTEEVFRRLADEGSPPDLVIGADSIVVLDGDILEKPKDEAAAAKMLHRLSGRTHSVISAVSLAVSHRGGQDFSLVNFHGSTQVDFSEIDSAMIDYYVGTKEPLDKAGSYGIQGIGGTFVSGIRGDYYNVVGLPLHRLCREILILADKGLL
eukprot:m.18672 g.18672  ORF g.18672 m.18672 type:complete len:215 (+) comp27712_c0_seq2:12-656(+)